MTAFEELERGDIIWATDPLSKKGRTLLVLGAPQYPAQGCYLSVDPSTDDSSCIFAFLANERGSRTLGAELGPRRHRPEESGQGL